MLDRKVLDEMFYGTVTVGERGQIVIPAEARAVYDISPGEKLLVFGNPPHSALMIVKMSGLANFIDLIKEALETAQDENDQPEASE